MSSEQHRGTDILKGVGVTALIVAEARARESERADRLFDDPFAANFVAGAGPDFAAASAEMAPILALRGNGRYFALRTRFIDDFALDATRAGVSQVVLLGAGLDTRAFRLPWPPGVRLFELDLPAVLRFKEDVLAARAAVPSGDRVTVAVDLREDWPTALIASGFDARAPTAWVAEGILMYLAEAERDQLLERIGALSAAGSRLGLDQRGETAIPPRDESADSGAAGEPDLVQGATRAGEVVSRRFGVTTSTEPATHSMTDPAAWLARHGWRADAHSAADVFASYGRPVPDLLQAGAVQLWLVTAERI